MRGHQIAALCFSEVIKGTLDLGFGVVGALGFGSSDLRKWGQRIGVRYQQACMQLRMSWCLGLLEFSPWGQSLTAGPSACPAICPSAPADWNPERVPGDTRAWESRGEDHDLQHAPVRCPLQQGFQAGQWAAAHLQGWQQAPGAGWGSALRVWVVVRSSGRSASSRLALGSPWGRLELHQVAFGSPDSSEPVCPCYHPGQFWMGSLLSIVCDGTQGVGC